MELSRVDIAVVGGGPAGCMAAIRAAKEGKKVLLLERNDFIGKKILLTSNGRCNFTNIASLEQFFKKIQPNGQFYRNAFYKFFNSDLIRFFEQYGVLHKVEDHGRVLPVADDAKAINMALEKALGKNGVDIVYWCRVDSLKQCRQDGFTLFAGSRAVCVAKHVIIAAGGVSYPVTGSSGDSFALARSLGHSISRLSPALVPLKLNEAFLKDAQGLSFSDVTLSFKFKEKNFTSDKGDILFTHFGLSGPLALDISAQVALAMESGQSLQAGIDFLPDIKIALLEHNINKLCESSPRAQLKTILEEYLPKRMTEIFLTCLDLEGIKQANQVTKKERLTVAQGLKNFAVNVSGTFSTQEGMVTNGGVLLKEIDPRTMQSRLVPGLYFAGEALEGYCLSGGYNLQQAFSTGYLAGESASMVE
jgi:predicted Rossmann fold flavoprotein